MITLYLLLIFSNKGKTIGDVIIVGILYELYMLFWSLKVGEFLGLV